MKTFTIHIPGFSIACKAWGHPDAPLILALHGWLDNANSFDLLAPYLANHFYLVAIDLPGHGHSSHLPLGSYYHLIDGIFITLQILDKLKVKQAHLLGHSLGGCLASIIAGVAPERVLSAAFIDAIGPLTAAENLCQNQLSQFLQNGMLMGDKPTKSYPSLGHAAIARAKRGYLSVEHAQILCERGMSEIDNAFYWRHDKRLLAPSPLRMTEEQVLSCLLAIKTKTILICANKGFEYNEDDMQIRIKAVKDIRVEPQRSPHILMKKRAPTY